MVEDCSSSNSKFLNRRVLADIVAVVVQSLVIVLVEPLLWNTVAQAAGYSSHSWSH